MGRRGHPSGVGETRRYRRRAQRIDLPAHHQQTRRQRPGFHPRRLGRAARGESEGTPGDRGGRQIRARLGHRRGPVPAPARRVHPHQRIGPRTARRRPENERDTYVLNTSGQHRTVRGARHGRRSALPERPREIPRRTTRRALPAHRQRYSAHPAQATRRAALGRGPHHPHQTRPRPRAGRETHPESRHRRRRDPVPARHPSHPGDPQDPQTEQPQMAHRNRVRRHRPHRRPSPPRPAGDLAPRPLVHRGASALGKRRDVRGRPEPSTHRQRSTGDGHSAEPRHQPAPPGRRHQHRQSPTSSRTGHQVPDHTAADQLKCRRHTAPRTLPTPCPQPTVRKSALEAPPSTEDGSLFADEFRVKFDEVVSRAERLVATWISTATVDDIIRLTPPNDLVIEPAGPRPPQLDPRVRDQYLWFRDRFSGLPISSWTPRSVELEYSWVKNRIVAPFSVGVMSEVSFDRTELSAAIADRVVGAASTWTSWSSLREQVYFHAKRLLLDFRSTEAAALFEFFANQDGAEVDSLNDRGFCLIPDDPNETLHYLELAAKRGYRPAAVNIFNQVCCHMALGNYRSALGIADFYWRESFEEHLVPASLWNRSNQTWTIEDSIDARISLAKLAQQVAELAEDQGRADTWSRRFTAIIEGSHVI